MCPGQPGVSSYEEKPEGPSVHRRLPVPELPLSFGKRPLQDRSLTQLFLLVWFDRLVLSRMTRPHVCPLQPTL